MVPKWHLAGQLAQTDFGNTHSWREKQKIFRFHRDQMLGRFSLLKNGEGEET